MDVLSKWAESDIDLWTDESLFDPYENDRSLRETGDAVWLRDHDVFALLRLVDVRAACATGRGRRQLRGVSINPSGNMFNRGGLISSDGSPHVVLRKIVRKPLGSHAITTLRYTVTTEAECLAEHLAQ